MSISVFHTKNNIISYNMFQSHRSLQEDCSYSSSWLLNYPNAGSIFWGRSLRLPSALSLAIDYGKYKRNCNWIGYEVKGMLFWEKNIPFLKSLGNEVCRWKHCGSQKIGSSQITLFAMKMLSQTSIAFWSLPSPYWSQAQKLSNFFFYWWNESRHSLGQQWSDSLISQWLPCTIPRAGDSR